MGIALLVAAASAMVVHRTRTRLAEQFHELRITEDVYTLPSPEQVVVGSLGYRSALADLLYGHVLVSYGLHFQERRRFEFIGEYLDTINALDPKFAQPYRFADTLIVMSPEAPRQRDYMKAKEVLERGIRELPYDTELWLTAGQYMAYLARPHLEDPKMREAWRVRGAEVLSRACELASDNENVPYHCITAASLFDKAGEREAAIKSLRRLVAVNDDPEIERRAIAYLAKHLSDREQEQYALRKRAFEAARQEEMAFVPKDAALIIGPPLDTAACAGPPRHGDPGCEVTWRDWAKNERVRAARSRDAER